MRLLSLMLVCLLAPAAVGAEDKPILVLEAVGHTGTVRWVQFTPDGRELISSGNDQTIRVWDVASGERKRVLRLPIFHASGGNASALSPDGRTLAVYCRGRQENDHWIYLIRLFSGAITAILKGHTGEITSLAFSPDGTRLASASKDHSARVWTIATGECEQVLRGHGGYAVFGVTFSPDGRQLATASGDETAKVWSLKTWQVEATLQDKEERNYATVSVAWSPDGQTIATGHFDVYRRLWKPDGTLIRRDLGPSPSGRALQFSADSAALLVSVRMVDVKTGADLARGVHPLSDGYGAALSLDGKLAASSGENGQLYLWDTADGRLRHKLMGGVRAQYGVAWSQDGKRVAWGNSDEGKRHFQAAQFNRPQSIEHAFQLTDLDFAELPKRTTPRLQSAFGEARVQVNREDGVATVMKGSEAVKRVPGQFTTCYTFLPSGRVAAYTTAGIHVLKASTGEMVRSYPLDGTHVVGREVCASPDERFLLSSHSDQTLRIWTLDRDKPLLSLFFAGNDWIAWTPEGYYAASPGGEHLMGWQINNGKDQMAIFYPAAQFRKTLYRPDVIKRLLTVGSLETALAQADKELGRRSQPTDVAGVLPPRVRLLSPRLHDLKLTRPKLTVRAAIESVGRYPVTAVRVLLDGRPALATTLPADSEAPKTERAWEVEIPAGSHRLSVRADNAVSHGASDEIVVSYTPAGTATATAAKAGTLHVLAIGINSYPGKLQLECAAPDAQDIAQAFRKYSSALFQRVEPKLLLNREATRAAILAELTSLKRRVKPGDVAIVFYAGHGDAKRAGSFHLVPVDANFKDLARTGVSGETLREQLGGLPCTAVLILDACFAGGFDQPRTRKTRALSGGADDLVRELVYDRGLVVLCGATKEQEAAEEQGHGFFTRALVEGLSGKARRRGDGSIYLSALQDYVEERVQELSEGEQVPTISVPSIVRGFPLAKP